MLHRISSSRFIFACYLILIALLKFCHEPWRDEADVWLMARDATFLEILSIASDSGTPALWYCVIEMITAVTHWYPMQSIVHFLVASFLGYLIWFRSPFSTLLRCLLLFGYYFSFEYVVVARNYTIGIALLFTLALLDRRRQDSALIYSVLLAMLANVSVHFLFFVGILFVFRGMELLKQGRITDKVVLSLIPALVGIAVAIFQLWPSGKGQFSGFLISEIHSGAFPYSLKEVFFPFTSSGIFVVVSIVLIMLILFFLRQDKRSFLIVCGFILSLEYIFVCKHIGGPWHAGLILVSLVFGLWISRASNVNKKKLEGLLALALLASLPISMRTWYQEIRYDFSDSKNVATFIQEHRLENEMLVAKAIGVSNSILPYFDNLRFWYAGIGAFGTYLKWDVDFVRGLNITNTEAIARVKSEFPHLSSFLLLTDQALIESPAMHELLYKTERTIWRMKDESYFIYEISLDQSLPTVLNR